MPEIFNAVGVPYKIVCGPNGSFTNHRVPAKPCAATGTILRVLSPDSEDNKKAFLRRRKAF